MNLGGVAFRFLGGNSFVDEDGLTYHPPLYIISFCFDMTVQLKSCINSLGL